MSLGGVLGIDPYGVVRRVAPLEAEVVTVAADVAYRLCNSTTTAPAVLRFNNAKVGFLEREAVV